MYVHFHLFLFEDNFKPIRQREYIPVYGGEGEEGDCGVEPASRGYLNPGSPPPRLHQAGQPGTAQVVGGGGALTSPLLIWR